MRRMVSLVEHAFGFDHEANLMDTFLSLMLDPHAEMTLKADIRKRSDVGLVMAEDAPFRIFQHYGIKLYSLCAAGCMLSPRVHLERVQEAGW